MKKQLCQKSKDEFIEIAEYVYREWDSKTGRQKRYFVCKKWLDLNNISIDSVDVFDMAEQSDSYVRHYKFED